MNERRAALLIHTNDSYMTKAFTISFQFEGKEYLALASIKKLISCETTYRVRVFDDPLFRILPEGSLQYSSARPLCPASLRHPQALRLFSCINDSLTSHLSAARW